MSFGLRSAGAGVAATALACSAAHGPPLGLRTRGGCRGRGPRIKPGAFRGEAPALNLVQVLLVLALALRGVDEEILCVREPYICPERNSAQRGQRYPTIHGVPRIRRY